MFPAFNIAYRCRSAIQKWGFASFGEFLITEVPAQCAISTANDTHFKLNQRNLIWFDIVNIMFTIFISSLSNGQPIININILIGESCYRVCVALRKTRGFMCVRCVEAIGQWQLCTIRTHDSRALHAMAGK